jgi:hypothetical protein
VIGEGPLLGDELGQPVGNELGPLLGEALGMTRVSLWKTIRISFRGAIRIALSYPVAVAFPGAVWTGFWLSHPLLLHHPSLRLGFHPDLLLWYPAPRSHGCRKNL